MSNACPPVAGVTSKR